MAVLGCGVSGARVVDREADCSTAEKRDLCPKRLPDPAIRLGWPVFAMFRACVAAILLLS